jgi:hypothetical protein
MPLDFVPFPISILFVIVFVAAILSVLWHIQKRGKIYKIFFYISVIACVLLLAGTVLTVAFAPLPAPTDPVEVDVTTNQPSYAQGEQVQISVYANNTHNWAVASPTSIIYLIRGQGLYIERTDFFSHSPLVAHSKIPLQSKTWYQTHGWTPKNENNNFVSPGNYTITVYFNGVGINGPTANCSITIKP